MILVESMSKDEIITHNVTAGCNSDINILQLPVSDELNNNLIESIKNNIDPEYSKFKVKACMTTWTLYNNYIEKLHKLIKKYAPVAKTWIEHFMFIQTWGIIYKHNQYSDPHHHWPFTWSWIYYAQVDDKSSPLTVYNIADKNGKLSNIKLAPKPRQLFFFPSYITHGVEKNTERKWRIVLSGDIILQKGDND